MIKVTTSNSTARKVVNYCQKGQTLVAVIFVMLIALTIGVTISTRFITSTKSSTQLALSSRNQLAADSGVERFVNRTVTELTQIINSGSCAECSYVISGGDGLASNVNVTLSFEAMSPDAYDVEISSDSSREIALSGYPNSTNLSVCVVSSEGGIAPNLHVLYVYGSQGNYQADNYYITSLSCQTITGRSNPVLMRLKPQYETLQVQVVPASGVSLPSQGIIVESEAETKGLIHKSIAIKRENAAPIDFDFVLFNRSQTEPLSN